MINEMESMEKLLLEEEQKYQEIYKGSRVNGTVEVVKSDSFYISLGGKTDGVLPKSEAGDCEDIKVGDTLDLEVVKIDKNTGEVLLSKKRLDDFKAWDEIHMGDIINVKVTEKNEKGLIARFKGSIRGFLPLSHIETRFIGEDALEKYIGQEFETEIIDLDPKKRRLILSRKNILLREQNELKKSLLEKIVEGEIFKGIVKDIKDYGIFVDLGGVTGLVHVSELSWNRKDNIEKSFKIDQEVDVKVLSFDLERERLSLSIKALMPNPWDVFIQTNHVGDILPGEVKNIKDYGIFVSLGEGIDGFVHISNISSDFIKNPSEVVKVGDKIEARILNIDPQTQKIELTLNLEEKEETVEDENIEVEVENTEEV